MVLRRVIKSWLMAHGKRMRGHVMFSFRESFRTGCMAASQKNTVAVSGRLFARFGKVQVEWGGSPPPQNRNPLLLPPEHS